jgi:hypothetical protein
MRRVQRKIPARVEVAEEFKSRFRAELNEHRRKMHRLIDQNSSTEEIMDVFADMKRLLAAPGQIELTAGSELSSCRVW